MVDAFFKRGWSVFAPEPVVCDWVRHARKEALRALRDPALDHLYQCRRTWFVGLDALPNDAKGRLGGSGPFAGRAADFAAEHCGGWPDLHRAQVSGVFPGYPQPREGETEAAFRYRKTRDAAHVDGVLGIGSPKRRFVQEPHAFVLGVPLTQSSAGAAPLVVWDGSHHIMRRALAEAFSKAGGTAPEDVDVTDAYVAARREIFETCKRCVVHAEPGSVYLMHRLSLHGVAAWQQGATASPDGRLIAYFRPPMAGGAGRWIQEP